MSSPSTRYRKIPEVRVRGVPELAYCLVFTPRDPQVHTLNLSAWLILQLCDGRSEEGIARAYLGAVEPMLSPEEARLEVRAGIASLLQKRVIQPVRIVEPRRIHQKGEQLNGQET